jgi:integrase
MARPAKPFIHQGFYCTNYGGIQKQKLCKVDEGMRAAKLLLSRLMVNRADAQQERAVAGPGIRLPADVNAAKTVADVIQEFLDFQAVESAPRTYQFYKEKLATLLQKFGTRPVASLTLTDGISHKRWLMEDKPWVRGKTVRHGLGPTTVNHHIRCARMLLAWAAKPSRKYILINPWQEIGYLDEQGRERIITDAEFEALTSQCTDGNQEHGGRDFREILTVMRNTTMRPGELRMLKWSYINWEKHTVLFPADVIKIRRRRQVTMNSVVEELLKARADRQKTAGYVFPGGSREDPNVALRDQSFSQRFRRLFERCVKKGLIERDSSGEKLVLYSTRHSRITELVSAQLPMKVVMEEAGHLQASTTHRYTHLADKLVTEMVRDVRTVSPSAQAAPASSVEPTQPAE